MGVQDDLKKAMTEAARGRDQLRLDAIRMVLSAVHYQEIEKRVALSDAQVMQVIAGLCKQRRESIEQFSKGGRQDLVDKESREIQILEAFLPTQLSERQVEEIVRQVIGELGASTQKDMGRVMKAVVQKTMGQADGKRVSEIVKSLLTG